MVNKPLHVSVGLRPGLAAAGVFGNLLVEVRASARPVAYFLSRTRFWRQARETHSSSARRMRRVL